MRNAYTFGSISRVVRASDSREFAVNLKTDRHALVEAAVAEAAAEPSTLGNTTEVQVRGKTCRFYRAYSTNLVVRATARYLSQRFRVSAPNRDRVVKSVIEALSEATPFHVIRRDIRSFYENIPVGELRDRLLYDTALPKQVRRHLRQYFSILPGGQMKGLPRGIGLTTILAELAMHEFDQKVRSIRGVYRYFRYSDDILVFCFGDLIATEKEIELALPAGMEFNPKKSQAVSYFDQTGRAREQVFDYLGYRFSCLDRGPKRRGRPRECRVSIAPAKIARMKTRTILSLKDYVRTGDHQLLLYRIRYLSGNYKVARSPAYYELRSKYTRSGIYFNYKRCGTHIGSTHTATPRKELMSLDWLYHHLLTSPKSDFAAHLSATLPARVRTELLSISFNKGHSETIFARVPSGIASRVKTVWRDH